MVADTGPILHLHEAGALHLLPRIGEVHLPPRVLDELRSLNPALSPKFARPQPLSPAAQQRASAWESAGLLHGGEAAALALALELKPDWFLTDDASARLTAETLNIEVRGSIGVLLWAAANQIASRSEAEQFWADLEKSSLWMSPRVRAEARAALGNIFRQE